MEVVRRGLNAHVAGRTIESVQVLHPRAVRRHLPDPLRAKFDSSDIVQSVWVSLLEDFRQGRWHFADEAHLRREYLAMEIAVAVVDGVDAAIAHVNEYGTGHTEAIVTTNMAAAQRFTEGVDAAAVMVNASTSFTDGEQFGFGAEIGISTQKLHARGPMGLPELTSTKWIVWGDGQTRPA